MMEPCALLILEPMLIGGKVVLDASVPALQVLLELLTNPLLEFLLLHFEAEGLDSVDDLDLGGGTLPDHVRVDVQLQSPDVVHVLVVYFGLLHLVIEDAILK